MRNQQKGFGLTEVLIALMLISFSVVALFAAENKATQATQSALLSSVAVVQLDAYAEYIASNFVDNYASYPTEWQRENQQLLPQADANFKAISKQVSHLILWWHSNQSIVTHLPSCPEHHNVNCLILSTAYA